MSNIQYHSVPLDEERSSKSRQIRRDLDTDYGAIPDTKSKSQNHWVWLAHALVLSVSMTFFALSLCLRSRNHTGQISLHGTTPVLQAVEHETKQVGLGPAWGNSLYAGQSEEAEEAWRSLTQGSPPLNL
jgi:hypothetical protein